MGGCICLAFIKWCLGLQTSTHIELIPESEPAVQATRDFAVEAAQLSEALAQKEEEVQMTGKPSKFGFMF